MTEPHPRQTISYLTRRFREVGLEPDSRHGQNFLIDLNLLELLVNAADLSENDVVLEIGTGTGSLTAQLAERAGAVVSVEIDEHLHQLASELLIDTTNVTLLQLDALHNKNRFHEQVLATVAEKLAEAPGRRFKLAANLPYSIATPVISNLLASELVPVSMTVTIQKEMADRLAAPTCTKDYSALSVWVQIQSRVEILRILPPTVFWPRPKVHSAIVHIVPDPARRAKIPDLEFFHRFVRTLFLHRRKFLRGVLVAGFKEYTKPEIDEVLERLRFPPSTRAEELPPEYILELCEAMRPKLQAAE